MKILQVNKFYYPWIGGVETIVQQIAEGLSGRESLKIDVLACNNQNKRADEVINGVNIFKAASLKTILGMPISFDFFFLYKKIAKNYDLIFLHYPFPLSFLSYRIFSPKKDLVIWYHSDIIRQKFLEIFFRPFHKYAFKKAKKIFVSNPNLIASSSYLKKFKNKCKVIPFGIDLNNFSINDEFQKEVKNIREKFGSPLILSVGRLTYYKGFDFLIRAAKNISAKFLIIGEGKRKKSLLKLIQNLDLQEKVFLIPPVSDLRPYYLACDIFVLPSIARSEAFGIVLLEAMAYGKPVISTELGTGTSWINLNGETGLVVEPKNIKVLEESIKNLINNKNLYQKFSQNAKERAERFNLNTFLENLKFELISL